MHTRVACQRVNSGSARAPAHPPANHAAAINTMHTPARTTLAALLLTAPSAFAQPTPATTKPPHAENQPATTAKPADLPTHTQTMPVSRYQLVFVKIPPLVETVEIPAPRAERDQARTRIGKQVVIPSFYISTTEVTWDCLDPFVYRLDLENPDAEVDATTRPSKPYIPPDRGYGHENFPAISITCRTAEAYCVWLTARTGLKFRLPTSAEWEHAAGAGATTDLTKDQLDAVAWHAGNAEGQTHAVKSKQPNAWGLYDMLGNAGEWTTSHDKTPRLRGGSFQIPPDRLSIALSEKQEPSWNASDPQIPKSKWWLPDAPFAGFRIVLECDPKTGEPLKVKPESKQPSKPTPVETEPAPSK